MRRPGVRFELALVLLLGVAVAGLVVLRPLLPDRPPPPTACPPVGEGIPAEERLAPTASVGAVAERVEGIRGHRFRRVPVPERLTQQQVRDRLTTELSEADLPLEAWERGLKTLRAIPMESDLEEISDSGAGLLGYYEPETGTLVIPAWGGGRLDALSRVVLAHELAHALVDEAVGLPVLAFPEPGEEDAFLARQALVEGDAMLVEDAFTSRSLTLGEQIRAGIGALFFVGIEGTDLPPHHLARTASFPYLEGEHFACTLYAQGGWDALDVAMRSPPETTAEVLFPRRYLEDEQPRTPPPSTAPADGWQLHRLAFGAADLLFLFEAPGGRPERALGDPWTAARGWGGGELHVWTEGERTAVALVLVEHPEAGRHLCRSVGRWVERAFSDLRTLPPGGGERMAATGAGVGVVLVCDYGQVRLGIAEDLLTARTVIRI